MNEEDIKELQEDIQLENKSIDPTVEAHLQEMGFLWDAVQNKLSEDKMCFACKKELTPEEPKHVVLANKVEKGVVAFLSICEDCRLKHEVKEKGE